MKKIPATAAALALCMTASVAGYADEAGPTHLSCQATHNVGCEGGVCSSTAEDNIHVTVSVALAAGTGNICTYTYCRDFSLTPAPGETVEEAVGRWTGFTLSQSRGSTEEHIGRPTIDYQLSISEDRTRFFLGGANNGGFGGWAGACTARTEQSEEE